MPKYTVYVERVVPQWRTVVVECDDESDITHSVDVQREIFDAACMLDGWRYDDDSERSNKPSNVAVGEVTDDERDLRIHNPEASSECERRRIMAYLDAHGAMSVQDIADALYGGAVGKVSHYAIREAQCTTQRWGVVDAPHGGTGTWYDLF